MTRYLVLSYCARWISRNPHIDVCDTREEAIAAAVKTKLDHARDGYPLAYCIVIEGVEP
jgi:hypothetical protein